MAYYTDSSNDGVQIASKEGSQPAWADQGVDFGLGRPASMDWACATVVRSGLDTGLRCSRMKTTIAKKRSTSSNLEGLGQAVMALVFFGLA